MNGLVHIGEMLRRSQESLDAAATVKGLPDEIAISSDVTAFGRVGESKGHVHLDDPKRVSAVPELLGSELCVCRRIVSAESMVT